MIIEYGVNINWIGLV